jgi:hypothetical protein
MKRKLCQTYLDVETIDRIDGLRRVLKPIPSASELLREIIERGIDAAEKAAMKATR